MVIGFNVSQARNQLLEHGIVYTYRWRRRAWFRNEKGDTEHTWTNRGRGTKKIADVDIHEIGQFCTHFDSDELKKYLSHSGFEHFYQWEGAIIDNMPPPGMGEDGWLYKVTKKLDEDKEAEEDE